MAAKILLFIGMFLFFFILHYIFYSFYSYRTRTQSYSGSIGFLFLFIGAVASVVWTALIFSHNSRGLLLPLTMVPSFLIAGFMIFRILISLYLKTSQKKEALVDNQKKNQDEYLSLTRGRHYDYIINIYNNKTNPLITQRDYEIACVYSKKNSVVDSLKAQNKYYELAIFYLLQNNYKESMNYFSLADSNYNYKFFYNKGLCLFHLEKYQEAIEAFDKAIELSPNPFAFFNRALAKARVNDVAGTASDMRNILEDKDIKAAIKIKRKVDFIEKAVRSL